MCVSTLPWPGRHSLCGRDEAVELPFLLVQHLPGARLTRGLQSDDHALRGQGVSQGRNPGAPEGPTARPRARSTTPAARRWPVSPSPQCGHGHPQHTLRPAAPRACRNRRLSSAQAPVLFLLGTCQPGHGGLRLLGTQTRPQRDCSHTLSSAPAGHVPSSSHRMQGAQCT